MRKGDKSVWLGSAATFTALVVAFFGAAIALDVVRSHYPLWTSAPMIGAYASAVLTVICFAGAMQGWNLQLRRVEEPDDFLLAERLLYLRHGRPPLVSEAEPLKLGIKPTIAMPIHEGFDTHGEDSVLPTYVVRDGDRALGQAITRGGIVLLHGRAASGKSRSAYEAIRRLRSESVLLVPAHPGALRELVNSGYHVANAIIWLDDLEQYLAPGGFNLGLLDRLCPPDRHDVAVVGTIRDEELARWHHASLVDDQSDRAIVQSARMAGHLITSLPRDRLIAVGQYLSGSERGLLVSDELDARVAAALEAGGRPHGSIGFAEYLAAGPAMMDRWSVGDGAVFDVGQALLSAAVDCRRAGYHRPIPSRVLVQIYGLYVSPARRDRADLPSVEEGFRWACQPVLGASSCLSPRSEGRYIASDYLLDRTQAGQGPLAGTVVLDEVWSTLLSLNDSHESGSVGVNAWWAGRKDIAEAALRIAADAWDATGVMNLGPLLAEQGRMHEAEQHWLRAANAGWYDAMYELGVISEDRADLKTAKQWYRRAAKGDDPRAMNALGQFAEAEGQLGEAERWYRRAASVDDVVFARHIESMKNLSALLRKQGRHADAEYWQRMAVEHAQHNNETEYNE